MIRMETHCHTAEVSRCSKIPGRQLAQELKASQFDAAVITDHFFDQYFENLAGTWTEKIDRFCAGYREAHDEGEKIGLRVFLGMELRNTESVNDYLIYGITPELLRAHERLYCYPMEQVRRLCDENGLLLYQAHPFRPGMRREEPRLLNGVEVFNGNARHNSQNHLAYRFAKENGLLMLSGSDHHQTEDRGRGGIVLERMPQDERELAAMLPTARLLPDILLELL